MRKLFSILMLIFFVSGMLLSTAEAARFGGGRSFGMQRSSSNFSRLQEPRRMTSPSPTSNRWLGPLAGFAAGGLMAYLFMGHGLGTGLLSWLAIFGVLMIGWNLLRSKLNFATQPMQSNQFMRNTAVQSQFTGNTAQIYPSDFDATTFLRDAKVQFIRLQAAYDTKDLNDIRTFTTPEVFAEIQLQLQERGDAANQTEVVSLQAELLDVATESEYTVTSVKFSGMIREVVNEPPVPLNEIWHFRKNNSMNHWQVAGVEQE